MKKLLCAVLLALFVGGVLGCGGGEKPAAPPPPPDNAPATPPAGN